MKRPLALLVSAGLLMAFMAGAGTVPGQDKKVEETKSDEPEPKKAPEPPRSQQEADLAALEKHSIDSATASLLEFFRKRTLADADREKMTGLVEHLGSSEFRVREKAMNDLLKVGPPALEFLRKGSRNGDLELVRRADACIDRIRAAEPPADVAAAALRLLAGRQPPELAAVLVAYLPYNDSEYITDEIRSALKRSARGKPAPILVAALSDSVPIRRSVAGEALADVKEHLDGVRKLLKDPEPFVRLRVAQALVLANDKSAVPVLIEALPKVTAGQAWQAEDILMRLAEGKNPPLVPRVGDATAATKYTAAWTDWWSKNEKTVNLAKLHEVPEMLGHTVIVLLDLGRVMELNAKNETIWQIDGVVFPLDVQMLPNNNVLVAEYHAGRVTERDRFKGEIKWEKMVNGPLMAQRLPNRNTVIATDSMVMEVNDKGEEVSSFNMPGGERLMKVAKAANGDIVALTSDSRVVRFDEKGKELSSFTVDITTKLFGGRIHVLNNGRVLIPHHSENKIVEYDGDGQVVWEANAPQPVAATRLPNGNTLVTTMQPQTGAIELDRNGRETGWNYKANTRVTRAIRR